MANGSYHDRPWPDILGNQPEPSHIEDVWLKEALDNPKLTVPALEAATGNAGWFPFLYEKIRELMSSESEQVRFTISRFLAIAIQFSRSAVYDLIEERWCRGGGKSSELAWNVMQRDSVWDTRNTDLAKQMIVSKAIHPPQAYLAISSIGAAAVDNAIEIAGAILDVELEQAELDSTEIAGRDEPRFSDFERSVGDDLVWSIKNDLTVPYKNILENSSLWNDLPELANRMPVVFLRLLWSKYVACFEHAAAPETSNFRYRQDHSNATSFFERSHRRENPFVDAIKDAITEYAKLDPEGFLDWLQENNSSDLLVTHNLLSFGLAQLSPDHVDHVVDYLLGDERRLFLGDSFMGQRNTIRLLRAVKEILTESHVALLEENILNSKIGAAGQGETAERRRDILRSKRIIRARLLTVLPKSQLSERSVDMLEQEGRNSADLNVDEESSPFTVGGHIGSPMTADQMVSATDDNIVQLLEELDDSTDWEHPTRFMEGGGIQAARDFANFSAENPERGINAILQLKPSRNERAAGNAIEAIARSNPNVVMRVKICSLVNLLEKRGFGAPEYREPVAHGLEGLIDKDFVLPEETVRLLSRWLAPVPMDTPLEIARADEDDGDDNLDESVLWGYGGWGIIPGGNYPILSAICRNYIFRDAKHLGELLTILQSHLKRREKAEVWKALLNNLVILVKGPKAETKKFLSALYSQHPSILFDKTGAIHLTRVHTWVGERTIRSAFVRIRDSGWAQGPQAYGELLYLHHLETNSPWTRTAVYRATNWTTDGQNISQKVLRIYLGITFAAANFRQIPNYTSEATSLLEDAMRKNIPVIHHAVLDTFGMSKPALRLDEPTLNLLRTISRYPQAFASSRTQDVLEKLEEIIPHHVEIVFVVSMAVMKFAGENRSTISRWWGADEILTGIALTLHRLGGEMQKHGLELFENLLEFKGAGAESALLELDKRPIRSGQQRHIPRLRRRRRSRSNLDQSQPNS